MRNFIAARLDGLLRKSQVKSLMPYLVELSCCNPGLRSSAATGNARLENELDFAVSPVHADILLVAGTITVKTAPHIRDIYEQMPEPRYVIAFGNCSISGGPYWQYGYDVLKGVDQVIPVDIYVPGCPPRFDALVKGIEILRKKIIFRQNPV